MKALNVIILCIMCTFFEVKGSMTQKTFSPKEVPAASMSVDLHPTVSPWANNASSVSNIISYAVFSVGISDSNLNLLQLIPIALSMKNWYAGGKISPLPEVAKPLIENFHGNTVLALAGNPKDLGVLYEKITEALESWEPYGIEILNFDGSTADGKMTLTIGKQ